MKCDLCERDANVEIVYNEDGKWVTRHLCHQCFAKEMGKAIEGIQDWISSAFKKTGASKVQKKCPHCGTTMKQVAMTGVGCLNCYQVFESELAHVYQTSTGSADYLGKAPLRFEGIRELRILIREKESEIKIKVDQDDFEDAARLRDEIQNLKTRLEQLEAGVDE